MARALLAEPDLPRKWLAGADRDVRACVFCPYCEEEDQRHRVVTCTLWPKDPADHRRLTARVSRLLRLYRAQLDCKGRSYPCLSRHAQRATGDDRCAGVSCGHPRAPRRMK